MVIFPVRVRLNEIIDEANPFIKTETVVQNALYNILLLNYRLSYVEADNLDEFKTEFKLYWNKNVPKYERLIDRSNDIYEKLFKFRDGTSTHVGNETRKNNQTKTEKFTPTETVTTKLGHTMTQDYSAPEADNKTTEKRFEQNAIETSSNSGSTTTFKYEVGEGQSGDITTRGGNNTTETSYKGDPDKTENNLTITDSLQDYDIDRFIKALKTSNVYDLWIDEFAPLFSEVLFYE